MTRRNCLSDAVMWNIKRSTHAQHTLTGVMCFNNVSGLEDSLRIVPGFYISLKSCFTFSSLLCASLQTSEAGAQFCAYD